MLRVSRRTKLTPDLAAKMAEAVSEGVPFGAAAAAQGIARETAHRWLAEGQEIMETADEDTVLTNAQRSKVSFATLIITARGVATQVRIERLNNAARNGDSGTDRWWLERMEPDFAPPARVEITGKGGGPVQLDHADIVKEAQAIVAEQERKQLEEGHSDNQSAD